METRAYFSSPSWGDDDGAVDEELEAAGGGFIDDADLGDGGDGDGFGGVAEGGDDALFLGVEAGEEVAEDELEGSRFAE